MREIKFRAWYKNKFYYFPIGKLWTPDHIDMYDTLCIDGISFEQFTGLYDKNGKEIYEGDVVVKICSDCNFCNVREKCSNGEHDDDCPDVETCRDIVTMQRFPKYWLKNEDFGYGGEDLEDPKYFVIIGNVHENPDLLNEV